jgi:uncharacterized lipoprotein YehR (DUF1307 family)
MLGEARSLQCLAAMKTILLASSLALALAACTSEPTVSGRWVAYT